MSNSFQNFLVWSEQRARSINLCPRQYSFRHLLAWEGWSADAPSDKQQAYHLNSVVADLRIETGNIVHDRIGRIVRRLASAMEVVPEVEIAIAEEDFDRFMAASKTLPLTTLNRKRKKLLSHLLGTPVSDVFVASERRSISAMLRGFFALPEVPAFTSDPGCLLREFTEAEPGPPTGELGVPARLKTDAVFIENGSLIVCDWKTGKPVDDHQTKGVVYDLFVRNRLGLPSDITVKVRFHYLRGNETVEYEFSDEQRQEALWRVGEEFTLMREKSSDPIFNVADPHSFPARTGFHCLSCAHQVMCKSFAVAKARGAFSRSIESEVAQ